MGGQKDGKAVRIPDNMTYDVATGELTWEPTESQVGDYEISFVPFEGQATRFIATVLITVEPRAIYARGGKIGKLLDRWYAEGTAAGNTGDFYDNRDNGHSRLNTDYYFPQLDRITYTDETLKSHGWGLQRNLHDRVVFGNSSTSDHPTRSGSNARTYYRSPDGLAFLYRQYRHNNLYVYPEHRDHDPGHNGRGGGFGDIYPANTPYLIISQGSSGSDKVFLRSIAPTLAAFRPEVKDKLIREGLLIPTFQMIFRMSNKNVQDEDAYLSHLAHPTVFSGTNVDTLKMVQMAHEIAPDDIPPMIQLKVLKEDKNVVGRDFFEPPQSASEQLADTPAGIARVVRGPRYVRTMVVSGQESFDPNKRKLTWHWVILRGDRGNIDIVPQNQSRSIVELRIPYHPRRPIVDGSRMESNRVDIGVFVHNGRYYSAPGFVTFFTLDREGRTYTEDGRLVEIDYTAGSSVIDFAAITDWSLFLQAILDENDSLGTRLLKQPFNPGELARIREIATEYQSRYGQPGIAGRERKRVSGKAQAAANRFLRETNLGPLHSVADRLLGVLNAIKNDASFFIRHAEPIRELAQSHQAAPGKPSVESMIEKLRELEIVKETSKGLSLNPLLAGNAPPGERLTRFQRCRLQRVHLEIMNQLLYHAFLNQPTTENFCDIFVTAAKPWCDLYRYAPDGTCLGWTRLVGDEKIDFNPDGHIILEKDAMGRAMKVRTAIYRGRRADPRQRGKLECLAGDELIEYTYQSAEDYVGTPSGRTLIGKTVRSSETVSPER